MIREGPSKKQMAAFKWVLANSLVDCQHRYRHGRKPRDRMIKHPVAGNGGTTAIPRKDGSGEEKAPTPIHLTLPINLTLLFQAPGASEIQVQITSLLVVGTS